MTGTKRLGDTRNAGRWAGTGLAAALAEAARALDTQRSLEETLRAIVDVALTAVPGFDHAGISLAHSKGRIETIVATGPLVEELDALQFEVGEGPCLEALSELPMVTVSEARHEQRWPRYMGRAARAGLCAQLSVHLFTDRSTVAVLNFYSTSRDTVDTDAPRIAELFAVHAAVALARAREVEGLHQALESRKTIGQAIGILMERYGLDEDRAFQFLLRSSQDGNVKLRDLAADLVRGTGDRPRAE
jgi:transcriptional regulator with GAF, ATPase, and Fis domain